MTIAAASARGDQVGFLDVRREYVAPVAAFPLSDIDADEHLDNATSATQDRVATPDSGKILLRRKLPISREELSKRAWTLQENLLSSRTVHYTSTELRWECQSKICFETESYRFGQEQNRHTKYHFLAPSNKPLPYIEVSQNQFAKWYQMSSEYAERTLTIPSDKFHAISGLAREFQCQIQATYMAGIWREDMIFGMAWSYFCRGRRTDEYRAPSWSWAAMDVDDNAKVKSALTWTAASIYPAELYWGLERNGRVEKAELLDYKMPLKDDDPFGAITRGEITLRTFCRKWPQNLTILTIPCSPLHSS